MSQHTPFEEAQSRELEILENIDKLEALLTHWDKKWIIASMRKMKYVTLHDQYDDFTIEEIKQQIGGILIPGFQKALSELYAPDPEPETPPAAPKAPKQRKLFGGIRSGLQAAILLVLAQANPYTSEETAPEAQAQTQASEELLLKKWELASKEFNGIAADESLRPQKKYQSLHAVYDKETELVGAMDHIYTQEQADLKELELKIAENEADLKDEKAAWDKNKAAYAALKSEEEQIYALGRESATQEFIISTLTEGIALQMNYQLLQTQLQGTAQAYSTILEQFNQDQRILLEAVKQAELAMGQQ